jgi:putative addiction module killer protein
MNTLILSSDFEDWFNELNDQRGRDKILARLASVRLGNFGDCEPVGEGISEMRIHAGPGYRVYFTRRGTTIYLLLTGGDKSSQKKDIARAKLIARNLKE